MTARLDDARRASEMLAGLDDAGVCALIAAAEAVGTGIGGTTRTARAGEADCFPLLLGWRIVDLACPVDLDEFDGPAPRRRWGAHWPEVHSRITEMRTATRSMVLFLEHVPETLGAWLRRSLAAGTGASVLADAVGQIIEAATWMESRGFQHFDVHPGKILVREGRLLFADFGLALHREFELTPEERSAMAAHGGYDRDTGITQLFHWVLVELGMTSGAQRLALLRAAAADPTTAALDPVRGALGESTDLIARHARVAVGITEMFGALLQDASAARFRSPGCDRIDRR